MINAALLGLGALRPSTAALGRRVDVSLEQR